MRNFTQERDNNITLVIFSDNNSALNPNFDDNLNFFCCIKKLKFILAKLRNKKSASFDNIPNVVLKKIPEELIGAYTILFNNLLNNGHFPEMWKTAKVVPILKKDINPTNPGSYRPISLLPYISKIFEIF